VPTSRERKISKGQRADAPTRKTHLCEGLIAFRRACQDLALVLGERGSDRAHARHELGATLQFGSQRPAGLERLAQQLDRRVSVAGIPDLLVERSNPPGNAHVASCVLGTKGRVFWISLPSVVSSRTRWTSPRVITTANWWQNVQRVLLGLLALALVDSINPSAIVVTLYLLSRERVTAQVAVYVAAIFVTYLMLGVMMMLGIDALLPSLSSVGDGRLGLIVAGLVGLAMLLYALRAPAAARSAPAVEPAATTYASLALLGVTVTIMELPTAVPYFGATALLTAADLPMARWLPLLVLYNAIFVLPPILLLMGHVAFGRLDARYADLRERLQAGARETTLWIFGLVGGALLVMSVVEYIARFR
jgi:cytochrome c biogenesis protein CcdA